MELSRTRLRATQSASCRLRLTSSSTILLPPRTKMVTALELGQFSITSMRSLVVPNDSSLTTPALAQRAGSESKAATAAVLHGVNWAVLSGVVSRTFVMQNLTCPACLV